MKLEIGRGRFILSDHQLPATHALDFVSANGQLEQLVASNHQQQQSVRVDINAHGRRLLLKWCVR